MNKKVKLIILDNAHDVSFIHVPQNLLGIIKRKDNANSSC